MDFKWHIFRKIKRVIPDNTSIINEIDDQYTDKMILQNPEGISKDRVLNATRRIVLEIMDYIECNEKLREIKQDMLDEMREINED